MREPLVGESGAVLLSCGDHKWSLRRPQVEFEEAEAAGSCGTQEGATRRKNSEAHTSRLEPLLFTKTHVPRVKLRKAWPGATGAGG